MDINVELVRKFISEINWDKVSDFPFAQDEAWAIEDYVDHQDFYLDSGISKIVMIPRDEKEQFVIKVPFHSVLNEDNGYFKEISKAKSPIDHMDGWDYCWREFEIYQLAREQGLADFFPKTLNYQIDPYPIYIQERCNEAYCTGRSLVNQTEYQAFRKEFNERTNHDYVLNEFFISFTHFWIVRAISHYGLDKFIQFIKFLKTYNITDLHSGNYGFSALDNRPLVLDFASYYEDEEEDSDGE